MLSGHRRRDVGAWLGGYAASLAGDQVFYLALTWAAAQVLSPGRVGLLLVCGSVPRAVVLLFGGVLVDRVGPKKVIVVSDSARTAVMATAALLLIITRPGPLLLLLLAVVFGVVDGFFLPAVGSAPAFVAAPAAMARLQAMRALVYRGAPVLGAAAGGWLLALSGPAAAFGFTAVVFALSVTALVVTRMVPPPADPDDPEPSSRATSAAEARVPAPPEPARPPEPTDTARGDEGVGPARPSDRSPGPSRRAVAAVVGEVRDGLRTAAHDPFLRAAVLVVTLLDLGLAGPMTAGPALVATMRGWGAGGAAALLAAMPAGAAVCAAVLIVRRPARAGRAIAVSAALTALGLLGVGVAVAAGGPAALTLAVGSAVLVGVAVGVYGTMIHTSLIQHSPPAQLGRVFALIALASFIGDPLSLAGTGLLEQLGAGFSFIAGSAVIAAAALTALLSRPLRTTTLAQTKA